MSNKIVLGLVLGGILGTLGIVFGLAVGAFLAWIIAFMQHGYYFQIMLPGAMVGLIVGYATQKYGAQSQLQRA